jgi:DNA mismatch endonuclease (patch repair protein)
MGFRYRVHTRIPGTRLTLDVLFPTYCAGLQIFGCYWHQHGCPIGGSSKPIGPNAATWQSKFAHVREREVRAADALAAAGYRLIVVWECEIRRDTQKAATFVAAFLEK